MPAVSGRPDRRLPRHIAATVPLRLGDDAPAVPGPRIGSLPGRPGPRYLIGHAVRGGSVDWFTVRRMGLAAPQ